MRRVHGEGHSGATRLSKPRGAREAAMLTVRVGEREHAGVQAQPAQRIGRRAERAIADDRMPARGELRADLAATAGAQRELEHRRARAPLTDAILGDRFAPGARRPHAKRARIFDEPIAQDPLVVANASLDYRHIAALDRARGELRLK